MRMRDVRRGGYDLQRNFQVSLSNMDKKELYAIAYYLFEFTKDISNNEILNLGDCGNLLDQLAFSLGLKERMNEVIASYVNLLVQNGKLHVLEKQEEVLSEADARIERIRRNRTAEYIFEEDEAVDRMYDISYVNDVVKNYHRVLYCYPKGTYSQLIYYIFFSTASVNPSIFYEEAPSKFKKLGSDFSKINFLKKELKLSDEETGYLLLRYYKGVTPLLGDVIDKLASNSSEFYQNVLGIPRSELNRITRPDGKIRQYGLMNAERCLNPALIESIEAQDLGVYFSDLVKSVNFENTYDISSFCVPKNNTTIYKNMLKSTSPVSLLLYGQPGSGKTEYAKALAKSTGKKVLVFKNETESSDNKDVLSRLNCFLSLDRKDSILIVDEADSLLSTMSVSFFGPRVSTQSKGVVNTMLENSQNKVIWIINYKNHIDESTLRRFTCSYKFESMSPYLLECIAEKKLNELDLSDKAKKRLLTLFNNYKVTGASVDNMIKTINSMKFKDEDQLIQNVEIVIKDNSLLLYGKSKMRETVSRSYDLDVLNTTIPSEKIMKMLRNAKNYADKNPGSGAVRMLFYGLSGTGKTEFARYISQSLGKKILLKRASDIFDKYVGGTEENIARAFSEAEANDMILLFDEADSFFANRTGAEHSWERTQVNEFLTQLEEFSGIVICTTNLREIMDPAMLRRFHITVEFKALQEEGVKTLLNNYFPECDFENDSIQKLLDFESVTPGDFSRLSDTVRFMDPEDVNEEYVIDELCNIQKEKYKNEGGVPVKGIGFCA